MTIASPFAAHLWNGPENVALMLSAGVTTVALIVGTLILLFT